TVPAAQSIKGWALAAPSLAINALGSYFRPGITWPPLRPEPPKPTSWASSTATRTPCSARCSAVLKPQNPAPTITTSACMSCANGSLGGASTAVAAHSEGANGKYVRVIAANLALTSDEGRAAGNPECEGVADCSGPRRTGLARPPRPDR